MKMKAWRTLTIVGVILGSLVLGATEAFAATVPDLSVTTQGYIDNNAPMTKYVGGVVRYGSTSATYFWIDTPMEVYYSDGMYTGYLQRDHSSFEHNFQNGTDRWVSTYSGTVRNVRGGSAIPPYRIELNK
jgi:hypothetical protein